MKVANTQVIVVGGGSFIIIEGILQNKTCAFAVGPSSPTP